MMVAMIALFAGCFGGAGFIIGVAASIFSPR